MDMQRQLHCGGILRIDGHSLLCRFSSPRLALASSPYNGGFCRVDGVFNHQLPFFVERESDLPGGSQRAYLQREAMRLGFATDACSGLLTSARMDCHGYAASLRDGLWLECVATGGVGGNAARAGEPAQYRELADGYAAIGGTINLLLLTNAALPHGSMVKALLTATEAKSSLLQDLAVQSVNQQAIATGTGTDGVILLCDPGSTLSRSDCGTQSLFGSMLSGVVRRALSQALWLQEGMEVFRDSRSNS